MEQARLLAYYSSSSKIGYGSNLPLLVILERQSLELEIKIFISSTEMCICCFTGDVVKLRANSERKVKTRP